MPSGGAVALIVVLLSTPIGPVRCEGTVCTTDVDLTGYFRPENVSGFCSPTPILVLMLGAQPFAAFACERVGATETAEIYRCS